MEKDTEKKLISFLEFVDSKYDCFEDIYIKNYPEGEVKLLIYARALRTAMIEADPSAIKIMIDNIKPLLRKVSTLKSPKFNTANFDREKANQNIKKISSKNLTREVFIKRGVSEKTTKCNECLGTGITFTGKEEVVCPHCEGKRTHTSYTEKEFVVVREGKEVFTLNMTYDRFKKIERKQEDEENDDLANYETLSKLWDEEDGSPDKEKIEFEDED